MIRHVAFLRGMNLGGRRLGNDELRAAVEPLDILNVRTFLASGNVVFDVEGDPEPAALEADFEGRLATALGYEVDTYVRPLARLARVVSREELQVARDDGFKPHVLFLRGQLAEEGAEALRALETPDDAFVVLGREVAWLRRGGLSDAPISQRDLEGAVGPAVTMRTLRTVERIVEKFRGR